MQFNKKEMKHFLEHKKKDYLFIHEDNCKDHKDVNSTSSFFYLK